MTGENIMGMSSSLLVLWGLMGTCIATVSILALAAAAIAYKRSTVLKALDISSQVIDTCLPPSHALDTK